MHILNHHSRANGNLINNYTPKSKDITTGQLKVWRKRTNIRTMDSTDDSQKSIVFSSSGNITTTNQYKPTRAKSFKISAPTPNYAQYVRTVKAYAAAGMPLEHIANAGEFIGDAVERGELDASLLEDPTKAGEIAEDENKILAWQNRGEKISIINQLPSAQPVSNVEITPVSNQVVSSGQNQEQTIGVLEGIGVFNNQPPQVSEPQDNSQLENNPYLKPPPQDFKKSV